MVHPLVSKPAPAVTLKDANGESYSFNPAEKGVPVVLFFYPKSGACRRIVRAPFFVLTWAEPLQVPMAVRRRRASSAMRSQVSKLSACMHCFLSGRMLLHEAGALTRLSCRQTRSFSRRPAS